MAKQYGVPLADQELMWWTDSRAAARRRVAPGSCATLMRLGRAGPTGRWAWVSRGPESD